MRNFRLCALVAATALSLGAPASRSLAQTPTSHSIGRLELLPPYTLTYSVTYSMVASNAYKAWLVNQQRITFDQAVHDGQMSREGEEAALEKATEALNAAPVSGNVVVSGRGSRFLCKRERFGTGPDKIILFDGKDTLQYTQAKGFTQQVVRDFKQGDLFPIPLPGVGQSPLSLIHNPSPIRSSRPNLWKFSGDIPARNGQTVMPALLEVTLVQGKPQVQSLVTLDPNGVNVDSRWEFADHRFIKGQWLASHMHFTTYSEDKPVEQYDIRLVQADEHSLPLEQFQFEYWLADGTLLRDCREATSIAFLYHANSGNWQQQLGKAQPAKPVESSRSPGEKALPPRPSIGHRAPVLECRDVTNRRISLDQFSGKVVLIEFWATWCPPCREEIPWLAKAYRKYHSKGFEIISLSYDCVKYPNELTAMNAVSKYIKANGIGWYVSLDRDFAVAHAFGSAGGGIPFSYLVGRDGNICAISPRGRQIEREVAGALRFRN